MERHVLIVDDEPSIVELLSFHLQEHKYIVSSANSGREALALLQDGFEGIVILDFKLPDIDGLELLNHISALHLRVAVIMVTGHGGIGMALEAITQRGAFYVHAKNEESFTEKLLTSVANAFDKLHLQTQLRRLEGQIGSQYSFAAIVTQSKQMKAIFRTLEHVIDSKVAVCIMGESGTGKELIARAIHFNGPRRQEPFVAINCAGIPESLLESELFGYEKGAFTGAVSRKPGKFEQASRGTIFLDEIGEMELALQAKLLRVLQEKSFQRLGGNETIHVDVRILSATNKNLEKEVANNRFREDLYYRLAVFPVHLPPLRERPEDIPLLADHFLRKFAKDEDKVVEGFTPRALQRLMEFDYPGNVRQLENIISHTVVVTSGPRIDISDMPRYLWADQRSTLRIEPNSTSPTTSPFFPDPNTILPLEDLEEMAIERAITICKGNLSEAAQRLGISRATLYRRRKTPDQA